MTACGADEVPVAPGPDASADVTTGRSTFDAAEAEPACDPASDLFRKVHDASIGDGSSTTGLCLGCARGHCEQAIAKCTHDCPCQGIVSDALECYLTTQQIGCAERLANIFVTPVTRSTALSLLGCVQTECPAECAVDGGGSVDAGDGAATD